MHTTFVELGPQNHTKDGLLGPTSMLVVYMDPPGTRQFSSPKPVWFLVGNGLRRLLYRDFIGTTIGIYFPIPY